MLGIRKTVPGCPVFLVDDDDGSRSALMFLLEAEGFAVRTYCCPEQLLNEGEISGEDCLVTDYNMPGMNGLELVSALRDKGISTPAILVTSDPNPTVRNHAAAANVPIVDKLSAADKLVGQIEKVMEAGMPWAPRRLPSAVCAFRGSRSPGVT
jgi:two-component system response regulator FixJ